MALFCRLCGARTDQAERFGVYCPGPRCGTDLRAGTHAAVQSWCEPERQRGGPGRTTIVRLTIRNAGSTADSYRAEPLEPVAGRLEFDAAALSAPLAPGGVRTVEIRYTPPRDRTGPVLDIASGLGLPGADVAGEAGDAAGSRFAVALRVASEANPDVAACAAFAVDMPGRFRGDLPEPEPARGTAGPAPRRPPLRGMPVRGMPLLVGAVVVALIAVVAVASGNGGGGGGSAASPAPGAVGGMSGGANGGSSASAPGRTGGNSNGNSDGNGNSNRPPTRVTTKPPSSARQQVAMRDLYGLSLEDAQRELAEDGLRSRVVVLHHSGRPKAHVRATEPVEGVLVDVGSTVVLHVTDGMFQLGNYVGDKLDNAVDALQRLGLEPVLAATKVEPPVPHRQIVATTPVAGSWVAEGDKVTLTYQYIPIY